MDVTLRSATDQDRPTLARMLRDYQAIISSLSEVPSPDRTLEDNWFSHEDLHPFVIEVDGAAAGMALVMGPAHATAVGEQADRVVYDYFVDERWRGEGVARRAARQLFATCPGRWSISVIIANERALGFWEAVLAESGIEPERALTEDGLRALRFDVPAP